MKEVAAMLKAIHAQEDIEAARIKSQAIVLKLKEMKLGRASDCFQSEHFGHLT